MRVLLIMPDYPNNKYGPNQNIILPPLGLEYIGACIQDIAEVQILDGRLFSLNSIIEKIHQFQPDYVGINCNLSSQIYHVNYLAKIAKQNGATTVLGGWHPTLVPDETLTFPWTDIIVRTEGELTFRELIQKDNPVGIDGLSYKHNGQIIHNSNRALTDLNQLPLPARNLRMPKVRSLYNYSGTPFDCMETSRGCPYRCNFCCVHNFYEQKYRFRSITHIMKELLQIRKRCRSVYFVDDNFIVNPKHIMSLCDAIIQYNLKMFFMTDARVDMVSKHPKVFEKMASAGFLVLLLGLESFSDETLQNLKKNIQFHEIKSAIKILHDIGFIIQGNIILGANFSDSEQDLEATIELAKSLDIDIPTFSLLTPYPGTELMETVLKNNLLLTKDWRNFNWGTPTIKYPYLTSEQLIKYMEKARDTVKVFNNPITRMKRILQARGLSFFLSRMCNFNFPKDFVSARIRSLVYALTKNTSRKIK